MITSFPPWRAHQRSNSSDDLIAELHSLGKLPAGTEWLRQVPVSFQLAPTQVIGEIQRLRPRLVICCGMAEERSCLSLERQARGDSHTHQTSLDLSALIAETTLTEISDDAGSFVCNHLYYSVLDFIDRADWDMTAVFVHVPVLTLENRAVILEDFEAIAQKLIQPS